MKPIKGLVLISTIAISLFNCTSPAPPPYRYHDAKGFDAFFNAVPINFIVITDTENRQWTTVPLRPNEVLLTAGDQGQFIVRGSKSLPDSLAFHQKDSLIFLNNELYGLIIDNRYNLLPFFTTMRPNDLRHLKSIVISGPIPEAYLPWLDTIGRNNPEIDLFLESDSLNFPAAQVNWISQHFEPRFLGVELLPDDYPLLGNFKHLESLYLMSVSDTLPHQPGQLPPIPSLRYLTIAADNALNDIGNQFLKLNPQLVSLCTESHYGDVRIDNQLPTGLQALYLYDSDSLRWLPDPRDLPNLTTLSISYPFSDTFPLQSLLAYHNVFELGLPADMRQRDFDSMIQACSRLRSLSIIKHDTMLVTDYSKLAGLKQLKHLVITGNNGSINPLKQLRQLDFLSLPEEFFEDSVAMTSLRNALPETRIAPNSGFCMGTGWILLVIPGICLSWLFWRIRKRLTEDRINFSKP